MKERSLFAATVLTAVALGLAGCSSGGGGGSGGGGSSPPPPPVVPPGPPTAAPVIQVLPSSSYDFGTVTGSNQPAPLQVTIRNVGNANLAVQGIGFQQQVQPFVLNTSPATRPCGGVTPTIAPNDFCNVQVGFAPNADGTFNTNLQVTSNGGGPVVVGIRGTRGPVNGLTVRINQIDFASCTAPSTTAYVSVTDQGQFPILGLGVPNFTFSQAAGAFGPVASVNFVGDAGFYKQIAISAILDNSGSLTIQPVAFADMNAGFASLLSQLKPTDVAEVIKFASTTQIVQSWTSDKTLLAQAIAAPFSGGQDTRLWDTVYEAADTFALPAFTPPGGPTAYRRVIVVATDGIDEGPTIGSPGGIRTLQATIDKANERGVAVFTIGIGNKVADADLGRLASETGGVYYPASQSQNLATIYQQLSQLLFTNQYVITFNRSITSPGQTPVRMRATNGSLTDTASRAIGCN